MGDKEATDIRQILPTGTVTFLFTDIEGSITLIENIRCTTKLAVLRFQLDNTAYVDATKLGRTMSLEQAITLALEE
jgi:hypothetical protein